MKKITKNFIFLLSSEIVGHLLGLVATVYLARLLGIGGFGIINYAIAYLSYALLFGNLGLTTIGAREISKNHYNLKIIEEIIGARILLAVIIFICFVFGILLIPGNAETKKIIFLYSLLLFPFAILLEFVFQGREEMEYIAISRFIQYSSYIVLLFLLVKNQWSISLVPISFLISYIFTITFLVAIFLKKYNAIHIVLSLENVRNLLNIAIPVGLATLFNQISINLAPIILGSFHTSVDVGGFSAAYRIIIFLLIIERIFYYLFFPIISRQHAYLPEKLDKSFMIFTRLLLALTLPITVGGIILAPNLIKFVYGSGYENAILIIRILLLYFLITPLNTFFGYGLVGIGQERQFFKVIVITSFLNIIMTVALGINFRGIGVGIALFISESIGVILMKNELQRYVKFKALENIEKILFATLIMAVILFFLRNIHFIISVAIGIISYAFLFYLLKGFTKEELKNIKVNTS